VLSVTLAEARRGGSAEVGNGKNRHERTANDYSPAFMIMAAAAISFLALLTFRETFRAPLEKA
jgi:hypothetical protein